jgi:hypothetical protein
MVQIAALCGISGAPNASQEDQSGDMAQGNAIFNREASQGRQILPMSPMQLYARLRPQQTVARIPRDPFGGYLDCLPIHHPPIQHSFVVRLTRPSANAANTTV